MLCWLTVLALVVTLFMPITAQAAETTSAWEAPTFALPVDDDIVKVGAHSAAVTAVHYLGGNLVTERRTDFGNINSATTPADKLAAAKTYTQLGVFGTSLNESPDPYIWNYIYNLYAATKGKSQVQDAVYMIDIGSPADADTTVNEELGTSYTLARKPDILLGINTPSGKPSYQELIDALNTGIETTAPAFYSPAQVNYKMATIYEQSDTMYALSDAIAASGKAGRYGDTNEIAQTYEKVLKGLQFYVLSKIADGTIEKRTVAVVDPTPQGDGTYKAYTSNDVQGTASSNRSAEYTENTTNNLLDVIDEATTGFFTPQELVQADVIVAAAGGGATTQSQAQIINNLKEAGVTELAIPPIYTTAPLTTFGIVMNSVENIYGIPFYQGFVYPEVINPVYGAMYLYEKMYHIADLDTIKSLVVTNFENASVAKGVVRDPSGYTTDIVQSQIDLGLQYYKAHESDFIAKKLELSNNIDPASIDLDAEYNDPAIDGGLFDSEAAKTDLATAIIEAVADDTYTGNAFTPEPSVTISGGQLVKDVDYTYSYSNNTNVGTAKVTVNGIGNYKGSAQTTFAIKPQSISKATVASVAKKTYTGKAWKPEPAVKLGSKTLKKGTDFTYSYASNTNAGTATVTVKGTGNYTGSAKTTFAIAPAKVSGLTIAKINDQTYNGSAKKPAPAVKFGSTTLKSGTHYTVTHSSNKNVGKASFKITGKGNYTGTKTVTYKINPKKTSITKVAVGKAQLTPTWKKIDGTTKYQVQYRVKGTSKWTSKTVSNKNTSYKITGLKKGKTYEIQVRSYKTVSKVNYTSAWSATKTSSKVK
jgi:hypothetical protein